MYFELNLPQSKPKIDTDQLQIVVLKPIFDWKTNDVIPYDVFTQTTPNISEIMGLKPIPGVYGNGYFEVHEKRVPDLCQYIRDQFQNSRIEFQGNVQRTFAGGGLLCELEDGVLRFNELIFVTQTGYSIDEVRSAFQLVFGVNRVEIP